MVIAACDQNIVVTVGHKLTCVNVHVMCIVQSGDDFRGSCVHRIHTTEATKHDTIREGRPSDSTHVFLVRACVRCNTGQLDGVKEMRVGL